MTEGFDHYKDHFGTLDEIASSFEVEGLSVSDMNDYPNALFCLKDDVKRALLQTQLEHLGYTSFRIFSVKGASSLILQSPEHRLFRLTQTLGEENYNNLFSGYSGGGEVPKSSAILQPIHAFEAGDVRCLIMPEVNKMHGLTQPQEQAALRLLQQKLLDDGFVCVDVDSGGNIHRQNVGWLSNGTPILIDVDGVVPVEKAEHVDAYASTISNALGLFDKAHIVPPECAWEDEQGVWQQHHDFPEILSGLPPKGTIVSAQVSGMLATDNERGHNA